MSDDAQTGGFQQRVELAAETALKRNGSVGPIELFQWMRFLQPVHFEEWQRGKEGYACLERFVQVGPEKLARTLRYLREWAQRRGLKAVEAAYTRRGPRGIEELQVTDAGDPEKERFYRTRYLPANLSETKLEKAKGKLKKAPELVVFVKVSETGTCAECGVNLEQGDYLLMEKGNPLCLTCADLDGLVFLPAGNTALTRRARKHSTLAAVVVQFNRRRKRYERQGLLATPEAVRQAEEECAADAPERAVARAQAAVARVEQDREFISAFTEEIRKLYPGCPLDRARAIAEHAGERSSGRVGRSAAGRDLAPDAVTLAVRAHIRHAHTPYDRLLMSGVERLEARSQVRDKIDSVLASWRG